MKKKKRPIQEVKAPETPPYFWGILGCLAVSSVYLLPQFLAWFSGFDMGYLLKADEAAYAARALRFSQNFFSLFKPNHFSPASWGIGNPWTFENRFSPALIPGLPEAVLSSISGFLCISVDTLSWLARGLFAGLGTWFLWRMLISFGMRAPLALIASVWVYADPGVYYYKPLGGLWNGLDQHYFNRFSNPLVGLTFFILALWAWSKLFIHKEESLGIAPGRLEAGHWLGVEVGVAGISLGFLFYISIYYWVHLFCTLVLALVLMEYPTHKKFGFQRVLVALVVAGVVALPYIILGRITNHTPVFREVIWRTGILIEDRAWYLLTHKALWLLFLGISPFLNSRNPGQRFLGTAILAGFVCFISSPFTGVTLQNFHWHYTLSPLCIAGISWIIPSVLARKFRWSFPKLGWRHLPILILPLASGWVTEYREFHKNYHPLKDLQSGDISFDFAGLGNIDQLYGPAWKWLAKNAGRSSVVMADPRVMGLVPIRTGLRIWQDSAVEFVPSAEILNRNQVLWYLQGLTGEELYKRIAPAEGEKIPIAQWTFGLSTDQLRVIEKQGFPVPDEELNRKLAKKLSGLQDHLTLEKVRENAFGKKLNYIVLGPFEKNWDRRLIREVFSQGNRVFKVFEKDGIEIIKVDPRINSKPAAAASVFDPISFLKNMKLESMYPQAPILF